MTRPVRLLLIEDSEDDAELIRLELERGGFELEWRRVQSEPDLLAALRDEWDVIVSDFQMPNFNGLQAFELYRQSGVDTPFIFVSGAIGEDRAVEAMRAGATDYLLKDNLARLSVAVKRELDAAKTRAAQRRAEEATKREQRRLGIAVEASGAGIFEHTVPLGPGSFVSERWAQILGYELDELPRHDRLPEWVRERMEPEQVQVQGAAYEDFVAGRTERLAVETRMRHKRGDWVDVALSAKAVHRDAARRATRVVGVMLDVSEHRKLESQLRQSQKMEAVGRLAGGVAHDFNNLLTVIISSSVFASESLEEGEPARADVDNVLATARKAASLTAQLLAFSRNKPVSPRILNLNAVVEEIDLLLRRLVGADVDVVSMLAEDLGNVRVDPGSLEQVITNLCVNARDAMPSGGTLTIETANVELGDNYAVAHEAKVEPGQYVVLAVSDEGTGMEEAVRRRIFEPFFTTKGLGKGTGLGLSTCYGIVKQAGGFIWVYSELGRGSTFKIYLPRVREVAERVTERGHQPLEVRGGAETILVAEDDEQIRLIVVRVLTRLGYKVIAVANGALALAECRKPITIDLLLTDVIMPEMSGSLLVQAATALRPGMKVLYMSGYTPQTAARYGGLEDEARVLQKPFTPADLAQEIRSVLDP